MKYARIEATKVVEISPETEESLEQWQSRFHASNTWVEHAEEAAEGDTYDEVDGTFTPPLPLPIEDVRTTALRSIDAVAGAVRARFITAEPGQESVYQLKREAAMAYEAAGYTGDVPAIIQAEATAQGMTAQEATDFILATAAAWINVAIQVEQIRQTAKVTVTSAATHAEIAQIQDDAFTTLEAIQPA